MSTRDQGVEITRRAWGEEADNTDPGRHDEAADAVEGCRSTSAAAAEPSHRWRNATVDWRLNEALTHLDKASQADPPPPARIAIAAARMHLVEAQSYLRDD